MSFLAISALFLLYIHFGKSLWFTWIPCNEASACRVSIIKQQQQQRAWQIGRMYFFFRYEHVFDSKCLSLNLQDALFFLLLGSVLEHHQINEDVFWIIKRVEKKETGSAYFCTWSVSSKTFYGLVGVWLHFQIFSWSDVHRWIYSW